ncbi:MAG TPA: cysteine-rich CWC family protein [Puia sp.]|nr:cysteine-rich CWC family protein [Puia sp.]
MCKHEEKYCPRCRAAFECKVGQTGRSPVVDEVRRPKFTDNICVPGKDHFSSNPFQEHITQCQCYGVKLTPEEKALLEQRYEDCLCRNCLMELKQAPAFFKEKFFLHGGK